MQESKSTKKLKIKELGTHKETLHFPHSHGNLWGIAVSPTGNIFVSDCSKHHIHVFNTQRQYIKTFSKEGTGKGQLKSPRGLAVDTNGLVYIANGDNGRVEVFKEDGSFVRQIGVGQLEGPCNVTIYGDRLFILDFTSHRVFTFNTSGELTQTIGGRGGGPRQFRCPTAVAVYNNELFITDFNNRVQVFSVNGQYNRELLRDQVRWPNDILITPDGEVLIADWVNHRVAIFNTSGDLLHRLDVPYPHGLAINTNSELLVSGGDGVCVFT